MSAHTPGPWVADAQQVLAPNMPKRIWGENGQYSGSFIVVQTHLYTSTEHAEAVANACLIAAAPELLEVARLLTLATDEGDDAAQGTHYVDKAGRIRCKGSFLETIEKARAALAKATGGAA